MKDSAAHVRGKLLVLHRKNSNSPPNALLQISREDAEAWCEEEFQLLEGQVYDYELTDAPGLQLQESNVVRRNGILKQTGTLEPGLNTGLLVITLENETGDDVAHASVEVRSSKLNYRADYRKMLNEITRMSTDILMQISEPSQTRFVPDSGRPPKTIIQQLAFLQSIILSAEFLDARDRILAAPHQRLAREIGYRDVRNGGFKASSETLSQLASGRPRMKVPLTHPLSAVMSSLPQRLRVVSHVGGYDTPENRFIKFALTSFEHFLYQADTLLSGASVETSRVKKGVRYARKLIGETLSREFFKDVHELTILPLDSPVLQRKPGYREMFQAWLRFNVAARLIWKGSEDVYGVRNRDVATLYQYWVFFKLLDVVRGVLGLSFGSIDTMIEKTEDGMSLKLKAGSELSIEGICQKHNRSLRFRLSYNRQFLGLMSASSTYPKAGSWTSSMRPDYTLSFWPSELSEETADIGENMIHLHFDAKYSAMNGTTVRDDLLKMHAYIDAIRRSEGAYVIYPGTENILWRRYSEILPSIGAFALSPGNQKDGITQLEAFLREVAEHVCDPTTKLAKLKQALHATLNSP